ncbi:hypothetical protein FRC02_010682 [Tulasnella sp. 418]|nr:hypothetical protein FRC02_010682 [Tulasnella sp. 418]
MTPKQRISDPHDLVTTLRKYVSPIDPVRCPNTLEYFKMEVDVDGAVWAALAPTEFQCKFEVVQLENSVSEAEQRMIGRLARQEVLAAKNRYLEVTAVAGDGEGESNLVDTWHESLDIAVVDYHRWLRMVENCSELDNFFSTMVQSKFPWVAMHVFFLAEAVVFLERGGREFCTEWQSGGNFRATEQFLFSGYL